MSIETDLRKEGIKVIKPIDTITVNHIAKSVAEHLCSAFLECNFDYSELFRNLSRLNMYIAQLPIGSSKAKYFYKNSSIYFSEDIDFNAIEQYAIHECIHYLQEKKSDKNTLLRLGLCCFTEFKEYGMALNEAAVQYMASKALGNSVQQEKYYDITLSTISPSYYPLQCNLIAQLAYITDAYSLFDSTINSNDAFITVCTKLCGEKNFYKIQQNMDKLLYLEEFLIDLNYNLKTMDESNKAMKMLIHQIEFVRKKIATTFLNTQNLIITSYFDTAFASIATIENIEYYRRKLYNYQNMIGITDGYSFFNEYYINKMAQLGVKSAALEGNDEYALVPVSDSKVALLFRNIRVLLHKVFSRQTD